MFFLTSLCGLGIALVRLGGRQKGEVLTSRTSPPPPTSNMGEDLVRELVSVSCSFFYYAGFRGPPSLPAFENMNHLNKYMWPCTTIHRLPTCFVLWSGQTKKKIRFPV